MLRPGGDGKLVTRLTSRPQARRREAREYDKFGDRWERRHKAFEYLCADCYAALDHQARHDLEAMLVDIDAGNCDRATFFRRYRRTVQGRRGRHGDR